MKFKLNLFAISFLLCTNAWAQQRPNAGSLQERPKQIPSLPTPGAPSVTLPQAKSTDAVDSGVRLTPAGFRFQGNTIFSAADLSPLVEGYLNKLTDLAGLKSAAAAVRNYYLERGYLLTNVYIPEQAFSVVKGTVTIAVVESRVGRVNLTVEGEGINKDFAQSLVDTQDPTEFSSASAASVTPT